MANRQGTFLISAILDLCKSPQRKTRVMYDTHMTYRQMDNYLKIAIEAGLLAYSEETRNYMTTPKGIEFLETQEKIAKMLLPEVRC